MSAVISQNVPKMTNGVIFTEKKHASKGMYNKKLWCAQKTVSEGFQTIF